MWHKVNFLSRVQLVWILFSFSSIGCLTKIKERGLPGDVLDGKKWFYADSKEISKNWNQTASPNLLLTTITVTLSALQI